jgi:high-affinity nickel permease
MFGIDDWLAGLSGGGSIGVVALVAMLLGLRHAADPDHVAAVTTLVAANAKRARGRAARLGLFWGAGHALTLVGFGVPILVANRYLPEKVQQSAETVAAVLIVFLAMRLLVRWRHDRLERHDHPGHGDGHRHRVRTPGTAFTIGLVHGMGGSAGVGVLLLAVIPSERVAVTALVVLALFTAVSMAMLTAGLGAVLGSRRAAGSIAAAVPGIGLLSLSFGVWYAAAAWSLAPYPF